MIQPVPEPCASLALLAAKQRYLSHEQVHHAVELYRAYQAAGGEKPSLTRILVAKGFLDPVKAEMLLRHIMQKEPLQPPRESGRFAPQKPSTVDAHPAPSVPSAAVAAVEPSAVAAPPAAPAPSPLVDDREAWLRGMGATVVKRDLVKGYTILSVKGEGAMGIVYQAKQVSMDRVVALKVLPPEKTSDQKFVDEFLAEARNCGRLNHPNLIHVHEVGKCGEVHYYSMEWVEGQRLDEAMDENEGGVLDPRLAVNIFTQVANALEYGLRNHVVHREIRPNCIMFNEEGQAKLADLGLAKDEETRFLDGENASYVAPEQVEHAQVDTRTDIYSLGCCLFHCLTGEPPFTGGTPKEVLYRRLSQSVPNALDFNPKLPRELCAIAMKMMAREPVERYQRPAEVVEALKRVPFGSTAGKKNPPPQGAFQKKLGAPKSGFKPAAQVTPPPRKGPSSGRMSAPSDILRKNKPLD